MAKIKVEGLDKLQKALKDNVTMDDVKRVIRKNGSELQSKMMQEADFTRGYATGNTKRSISLDIKDNGLTAEVGATTEYAPYLEYGTRFMSAQPFVKPALDAQVPKYKSDMQRLVK
jgi:HK97 gp10 family phage protein